MKQIKAPMKTTIAICGHQNTVENTSYRYTKHCVKVPCEDGVLLCHTLTGELVLVGRGEDSESTTQQLIKSWFLVPEDFDECKWADEVRHIAKLLRTRNSGKSHFTILTTTDCNARCFYCYEMGMRRYTMTAKTARDVGEYIARVCKGKKVTISWFGGEPLLNREPIEIISRALQERGIPFDAIITSNGYYLDTAVAEKAARDWHIISAQITIDGTEENYNRTKAYINCDEQSPYRRVLDNIGHALDAGMCVNVRLNMDRANADDLFAVVEELAERFGPRPELSVHVALLKKLVGDIHAFTSGEEALSYRNGIEDKLRELGYLRETEYHPGLSTNQCMADNDSCEVILPDGRIEKCEHLDEKEIVGDIYSDDRNKEIIENWKETVRFSNCADCALYPKCVSLKKCPWMQEGCSQLRQISQLKRIEQMIRNYYLENRDRMDGTKHDEVDIENATGGSRW
ncbi:MAG: 4Fe-4S cluster-binding domain-containing protein [Oscillospiraceae bacterium]|nr:4Fe-4S cluster-binding domain-containing protein [Oscillospiraceae bacterium]